MARKLAHESDAGSGPDDEKRTKRGELTTDRRGCLRLGGAAIAAMATATGGVAAAAGSGGTDDGRRLVISGTGDVSGYEVTVDGSLTPAAGAAAADISGHSAEGVVGAGSREYRFTGDVRAVRVETGATVYVDGAAVGDD